MSDKPVGETLRHTCPVPHPTRGLVWRCPCGRRWKVIVRVEPGAFRQGYVWTRRYLPWNGGTP